MRDRLLILSVFVVASCGLAYELIAGALASYLLGDSILQFSTIIGCYLFAMGVGSHLSRYVPDREALSRFVQIELLVGVLGGLSATLLFLVFAWASAPFRGVLYALVFVVGVLVGLEIPLVMRVLNERRTAFGELVSRVLTFDYLGALAVSLLFPLVLAPMLGLARTALLFGLLNVGIALLTLRAFRREIAGAGTLAFRGFVVLALLAGGFALSDRLTTWSEERLYGGEIVHAETTAYQRVVVTRWKDELRLHLNGNLQFSSRDEHRYHEALVHPALANLPWARNILILGGGDGLAVREILRHRQVARVVVVDLDPAMTRLFSTSPPLIALNGGSLSDPRVTVVNADAGRWLEETEEVFDAIVVDLPDPSNFGLGKLYSVPVFRLLSRRLAERGLAIVQSTSPYHAPHAFWTIDATLREAGFRTWPYHVHVPSFGEWGFIVAGRSDAFQPPDTYAVRTRFLDGPTTAAMFRFPPDMPRLDMAPNRLNTQTLVHRFAEDWQRVMR